MLDLSLWSLLKNILSSFLLAGRHFVVVLRHVSVSRVIAGHFSKLQLGGHFHLPEIAECTNSRAKYRTEEVRSYKTAGF